MSVILGINSVYHESAAALIVDGEIIAAAEEERFTRVKHAKPARVYNPHELPISSISYCLTAGNIDASEIDIVAYSFCKDLRRSKFQLDPLCIEGDWGSAKGEQTFLHNLDQVSNAINELLGSKFHGKIVTVPHHLAHAASCFYPSGFVEAAILIIDGIGESASSAMFCGQGTDITPLSSIEYPASVGFLWEKLSEYFGFSEYDACKTMGLAAYGNAMRKQSEFDQFVRITDVGFEVNPNILQFRKLGFEKLEKILGPHRAPGQSFQQHHYDSAAALQACTSSISISLAKQLKEKTGSQNLCLAGGVALNCVTNSDILKSGLFDDLYIPPAPHDAGTAIGAALHVYFSNVSANRKSVTSSPYLGPTYSNSEIEDALQAEGIEYELLGSRSKEIATLIAQGNIVAWFQGRMEYGPRALGNRSLLADPRRADMRDILNQKVKHREDFRPFAPSVLAELADQWFDLGAQTLSHTYMLFAAAVLPEKGDQIPAVLHVDNTARLQTVDQHQNEPFHKLISSFYELTGVPMLLNTSFNDSEPIVCSPKDAVKTFVNTSIDALVLGDFLVLRETGRQY